MENRIKFKRHIRKWGDSVILTFPTEIMEYLQLEVDDEVVLMPEKGKHGNYVSFWKKKG